MRIRVSIRSLFWGVVLSVCALNAHAAELLNVRFGPNGDQTRVVFDIKGAPKYELSGDGAGQGRLILEFSDVAVRSVQKGRGKGHFQAYSIETPSNKSARATLSLKRSAKLKEIFVIAPRGDVKNHRLVIDVVTASKSAFLSSLPKKYTDLAEVIEKSTADKTGQSDVKSAPTPTLAVRRTQRTIADENQQKSVKQANATGGNTRYRVVIDAGHGGADPGAIGQNGTLEKEITLAAALELKEILKKTKRYDVILTRTGDERLRPAEREAAARAARADLFISIHADALSDPSVRGASVYTLSEEGTSRSEKIAREEGNYVVHDLDLQEFDENTGNLLFHLAQSRNLTQSSIFAEKLIKNLTGRTKLVNRTHRRGDLRVLLAPDVPAVLLELAFLSNKEDEENLNSAAWRTKIVKAVATSINQYFDEKKPRKQASRDAAEIR
ncbi:MAG: N-acetylmuramoyl-L-alanine amidase [Pseudomonadota bacterium]